MIHLPALPSFVMALLALFLKTTLVSGLQIVTRVRSRRYLLPEDAGMAGLRPVEAEAELVQRCARVWRNDVENLPLFLALALSYVLLGGEPSSANWLFGSYVLIRYLHTAVYLRGLQPWRAMLYIAGMLVCWMIVLGILHQIRL
ncbi:MAPEG family protein [Undibacterium sp. TS12]|uniref:MAPEG family protein n=1 Tax=Undibacterium sp. TS12 TaxID=2908202 RepID=UPI001F4D0328|nr:MAPEG family protein [Undibacterium sp. TS12]MCH8618071.1 MAPEG family protein [Undibacterium sp. TS12]